MTKIRTIRRTKGMPPHSRWRICDEDGTEFSYYFKPNAKGWSAKELRTLRRIVTAPKKPKRKMIRVWYFQEDQGLHVSFKREEMNDLHELYSDSKRRELLGNKAPGPIESALIPAPRKKGKAK